MTGCRVFDSSMNSVTCYISEDAILKVSPRIFYSSYDLQSHALLEYYHNRSSNGHRTQKLPSSRSDTAAADQGQEIPDSLPRSKRAIVDEGVARGLSRWGGENFSPVVARIKRLIVKATCAREPPAGWREVVRRARWGRVGRTEVRRWRGVKVAINFSSRD